MDMKDLDIKHTHFVGQIWLAQFKTVISVLAHGMALPFAVTIFLCICKQ